MEIDLQEKINNLLNSSDEIVKYTVKTLPKISDSLQKTKFKQTGTALLSLFARSGYLNSAILHVSGTENIYASAILLRSMIEHNFRHLYIFVKSLNDDSDEVGKRYYRVLRVNEDRQALYNINKYTQKIYPNKTKWNLANEHNKSIRENANEFRIDEIFCYLVENNNDRIPEIALTFKKEYLLKRLIQYTNISSSVHGGPFGESTLMTSQKENPKAALLKFATEGFELHKNLVNTTYLFTCMMDKNNKEWYEGIKNISEK
jgi:hypothetical protein